MSLFFYFYFQLYIWFLFSYIKSICSNSLKLVRLILNHELQYKREKKTFFNIISGEHICTMFPTELLILLPISYIEAKMLTQTFLLMPDNCCINNKNEKCHVKEIAKRYHDIEFQGTFYTIIHKSCLCHYVELDLSFLILSQK